MLESDMFFLKESDDDDNGEFLSLWLVIENIYIGVKVGSFDRLLAAFVFRLELS